MKYIRRFYESSNLNENEMKSIINSIIDEEISISKNKFDMEISDDIIQLEKDVIGDAIIVIWDDIKCSNNREYGELMNFVFNGVEKLLPIKELFNSGNKDYKVHINCVIYKIFLIISNNKYENYLENTQIKNKEE